MSVPPHDGPPRPPRHSADAPPGSPADGHSAYIGAHRLPGAAVQGRVATRGMVIGVAALALLLVVGLFFAGRWWAGSMTARAGLAAGEATTVATGTPTPTPSPTPTPTPFAPVGVVPAGPAAVGVQPWTALAGGECLGAFESPFAEEFTVVDCAVEHPAQLVSAGVFEGDPGAAYPGEGELRSRMNLLCTAPTVLDTAAAGAIPDLRWQAAYPLEAGWNAGDRRWFCFFARESGEPLGATLVPPAA